MGITAPFHPLPNGRLCHEHVSSRDELLGRKPSSPLLGIDLRAVNAGGHSSPEEADAVLDVLHCDFS